MYQTDIQAVAQASAKKSALLQKNPLGFLISSMLAGAYIGFGIVLVFTIGGALKAANSPFTQLAMGLCFGAALSLVVMAGAELFTGNALVMTVGSLQKEISWKRTALVLIGSYLGNLLGGLVLSFLMVKGGLYQQSTIDYILACSALKMHAPFLKLFFAGILCNILVCLPVWCSFRMKSESGKLIMIFWGILLFVTPGFEHCVANMTLLSSALMLPHEAAVSLSGFFYNILTVALGNLAGGGLIVGGGYHLISRISLDK